MPQDAFTIKYVAKELHEVLEGGKISKIAQPEKDLLTLIIYTEKGSVKLEICLSAKYSRISLAKGEVISPKTAPAFCMLLRKHLQNAKVLQVGQIDGERIVFIDLECTNEFERTEMTLYAELMGKYSNCILVKDGVISGALKTSSIGESTKRILFPGAEYVLPEAQDKLAPDDVRGIAAAFENREGGAAEFVSEKIRGVSYATAVEIAETYGERVTARDVCAYLSGEVYAPCVTYRDGKESDFKVRSADPTAKRYPSLLEAQTAFYAAATHRQAFEKKKRKLISATSSAAKKLEKRLATERQKLADCEDMETVKLKGELLTANIYAVKRGSAGFEAVNYYDESGGTVKIELDKSLSPADNAQKYYKKYAKLKRTAVSVAAQKVETESALKYLNSVISHIYAGESLDDFKEIREELKSEGLIKEQAEKKKTVVETPFRTFIKDGFKIFAGRSNLQNDKLLKSVSPRDIWLHTQKYHSSHVVIITEGKPVPNAVLLAAAEICAYYSDGRGGSKIPVDYALRASVKKPPKSAAGFVIYNDFKTILADPAPHAELRND